MRILRMVMSQAHGNWHRLVRGCRWYDACYRRGSRTAAMKIFCSRVNLPRPDHLPGGIGIDHTSRFLSCSCPAVVTTRVDRRCLRCAMNDGAPRGSPQTPSTRGISKRQTKCVRRFRRLCLVVRSLVGQSRFRAVFVYCYSILDARSSTLDAG